MKISAIVAMGSNRVIGKNNQLMWEIPSETKHYKDILGEHFFIIGRKNYEGSLTSTNHGRALVLTTNPSYRAKAQVFNIVDDAISFAQRNGENELFILGGQEIYNLLMPKLDYLYLSLVNYCEPGDTYFPPHENYNWILEQQFHKEEDDETPYSWSFQKLRRKRAI